MRIPVAGRQRAVQRACRPIQALSAASRIGDDTLQRDAGQAVALDGFPDGSPEQRINRFRAGLETGDPARRDTFDAARL